MPGTARRRKEIAAWLEAAPFAILLAIALGPAFADTTYQKDPATRIETWETHAAGIDVRLTQIGPDQAAAFFLGRGFPIDDARHYAQSCVFMTVVRNSGAAPLTIDLRKWRVVPQAGSAMRMRVKEDWLDEWSRRGLSDSALIAFSWSQFPTTQEFETDDWNQGMTTYALPRGSRFDLMFEWQTGGKVMKGILEGARCAAQ